MPQDLATQNILLYITYCKLLKTELILEYKRIFQKYNGWDTVLSSCTRNVFYVLSMRKLYNQQKVLVAKQLIHYLRLYWNVYKSDN